MIIVKMKCFNPDGSSYINYPAHALYRNMGEAWNAALKMAEDESESLNDEADDGVSFGVVEDEEKTSFVSTTTTTSITTQRAIPKPSRSICLRR